MHDYLLLIHAKGDPLIPVDMGKRFFKAAHSSPLKELVLVDADVHNNAAAIYKDARHLAKLKLFARGARSVP